MQSLMPTWLVEYETRRPTLTHPLTSADRGSVEVWARDLAGAKDAFRQRYAYIITAVSMKSAMGGD